MSTLPNNVHEMVLPELVQFDYVHSKQQTDLEMQYNSRGEGGILLVQHLKVLFTALNDLSYSSCEFFGKCEFYKNSPLLHLCMRFCPTGLMYVAHYSRMARSNQPAITSINMIIKKQRNKQIPVNYFDKYVILFFKKRSRKGKMF